MSTDIERAFSRGRLTVSRLHYSLSDASVRASTLLGSWARIPDLVSEPELVALLKRRARSGNDNIINLDDDGEAEA